MTTSRAAILALLGCFAGLLNWLFLGLSKGVLVIVLAFCGEQVFGCVLAAYLSSALTLVIVALAPLLLATFIGGRLAKQPATGRWATRAALASLGGFLVGAMLLGVWFGFSQSGTSRSLATVLRYSPAFCSLIALGTYASMRIEPAGADRPSSN